MDLELMSIIGNETHRTVYKGSRSQEKLDEMQELCINWDEKGRLRKSRGPPNERDRQKLWIWFLRQG